MAPKDVKQGHFAVFVIHDGKAERFVLKLSCLENPAFVSLLYKTEEKHGFHQRGIITLVCPPGEVSSILAQQWKERRTTVPIMRSKSVRKAWRRIAVDMKARLIKWFPSIYFCFLMDSFFPKVFISKTSTVRKTWEK